MIGEVGVLAEKTWSLIVPRITTIDDVMFAERTTTIN